MVNDETVNVRLPKEVKDALKRVAIKENRKPTDVARIAIIEFLRSKGQDV